MKNHWLEKRRTREQRQKVLKEIAQKGLGHFTNKQKPILWFSPNPAGGKRGKVPSITEVFDEDIEYFRKSLFEPLKFPKDYFQEKHESNE